MPQLRRSAVVKSVVTMRTFRRWAAVLVVGAIVAAVVGTAAHASPRIGTPPAAPTTQACQAAGLSGTYTVVTGSAATGHIEYTLTITNRSAVTCTVSTPLHITLLGAHGQGLPTEPTFTTRTVALAPGQWAQAQSEFSPDFASGGEPTHGNCEPTAHALRIDIGAASVRAPMDPSPVCGDGTIAFRALTPVALTRACRAAGLTPAFTRDDPPFHGFAQYSVTLRNRGVTPCHLDSIVGLSLRGTHGAHLETTVHGEVSSPAVLRGHRVLTATARVATSGGHCDAIATHIAITPSRGAGSATAAVRPPVAVCRRGLIQLSSVFVNG